MGRKMTFMQRTPLGNSKGQQIGEVRHDGVAMAQVGDVMVPEYLEIDLPGSKDQPSLLIEAELVEGVLQCTKVCLTAKPGGGAVTGEHLRLVRVESWIEQVSKLVAVDVEPDTAGGLVAKWTEPGSLSVAGRRTVEKLMPKHGRRPLTEEHYQRVADVHAEHGSVQGVAEALEVPFSTAARWVRTAKQRGLIEEGQK